MSQRRQLEPEDFRWCFAVVPESCKKKAFRILLKSPGLSDNWQARENWRRVDSRSVCVPIPSYDCHCYKAKQDSIVSHWMLSVARKSAFYRTQCDRLHS